MCVVVFCDLSLWFCTTEEQLLIGLCLLFRLTDYYYYYFNVTYMAQIRMMQIRWSWC